MSPTTPSPLPPAPPAAAPAARVIEPARFAPPPRRPVRGRRPLPWRTAVLGAFLVGVCWSLWFVLTARSVGLLVDPPEAAVSVTDWPAPRIGDHWLLRPGSHRVRAHAPGHRPFDGIIEVGPDQLQRHAITLERLPGRLRLTLAPVPSADVYIDGERRGTAPGVIEDVRAGTREVEVRAERYLSHFVTVEVEGKGREQGLDITLAPAWAEFAVDSRPAGAEVRVDGRLLGATPGHFELLQGRRQVEIGRTGYKTWRQTLDVVAGTPVLLGQVVLAKADGVLLLSTRPAGANVTVDGEFAGRTPLELPLTPERAHTVRASREGYAQGEARLTLDAGERRALDLELVAELAPVRFITEPADAELLVDGKPRGNANQVLSLPTHGHEVVVRRAGYATWTTTVTPRKGIEKRYRIRLKTAAEVAAADALGQGAGGAAATAAATAAADTDGEAAAARLRSAAGQDLVLFEGGRILLGSPRRDAARRANEIEREAQLTRPFYLATREVSNAEFRQFLASHHVANQGELALDDDRQPAVGMPWHVAAQYCNWLSRRDGLPPFYQIRWGEVLGVNPAATGYRLPTEAEWEWAARSEPGGNRLVFPWGEQFPPRGRSGNYADKTTAPHTAGALIDYDDGYAGAAPVGSFSPNLRGLYDLGGNVAEWVHDYYEAEPAPMPVRDPLGPAAGQEHVIKGASWAQGSATALRLAHRDAGQAGRFDVGFRIARYAR